MAGGMATILPSLCSLRVGLLLRGCARPALQAAVVRTAGVGPTSPVGCGRLGTPGRGEEASKDCLGIFSCSGWQVLGVAVVWCGVGERTGGHKDINNKMVIWRKVLGSDCLATSDSSDA